MPLVHSTDLIRNAAANDHKLLELRPRSLAAALALRDASEACDAPVIVALSDDGLGIDLGEVMPILEVAFARCAAPIVLHYSPVHDRRGLVEAIRLGFCSVAFGAEVAPGCDVAELTEMGRRCGLATEAAGLLTEAEGRARLARDFDLIGPEAIAAFKALAEAAGSASRGREAVAACRVFAPVEHVVAFNAPSLSAADVDRLFALGVDMLGAIPGVRQVRVGRAIADNARYRLCWFVRFANAAVADSYRHDPAHLAFADGHFRPVAADRMTIDYELSDR